MDIIKLVENYREDIVKHTQELVKIKSVEEAALPNMPFGQGVNDALEYALNLSKELGFDVENFEGYAGHADLGDGEETIGILGHLDVVPEGEGWTYPPYSGEIHDNKIYGRGTIDDKGPMIAALFAMKAVKDSGVEMNKKIRAIFGTNEETGWGGINYYLDKVKAPDMAFTPDADFPVIHGEKGIQIFDMKKKFESKNEGEIKVIEINGGNRPNMVPDSCEAIIEVKDKEVVKAALNSFVEKTSYKMSIEEDGSNLRVISKGKSAHGSMPESGQNAVSQMMVFLDELNIAGEQGEFIKIYKEKIGMEYYGQSVGCGFEDKESGKLIFNVGVFKMDESEAVISVNVRYPITIDGAKVYEGMNEELKGAKIEIEELDHMAPIYMPEDHPLVSQLMNVYKEVSGDTKSKPITIGGGTYARAMKNAVAFGPLFPGQEELAHQKDEYIGIEELMNSAKIYAKALYELVK